MRSCVVTLYTNIEGLLVAILGYLEGCTERRVPNIAGKQPLFFLLVSGKESFAHNCIHRYMSDPEAIKSNLHSAERCRDNPKNTRLSFALPSLLL